MTIYEGQEKYIFVSYSHKNSDVVLPLVQAMIGAGFRVWYDEGIEAGTEWPAYIEEHLLACDRVLVFLSPDAVDSINCRNEINLAASEKKEMLVVYLEETKLKHGLGLQLGTTQSLFRYRHDSDKSFVTELLKAKLLQPCKEGNEEPDEALADVKLPPQAARKKEIAYENNEYQATLSERAGGPSAISRAGVIASNDATTLWPAGTCAQSIDLNSFSVLHFQANLLHAAGRGEEKKIGVRVFNESNALVFEYVSEICFREGDFKFSVPWVVKEENGFTQAPGAYRALLWVEDSRTVEIAFDLVKQAPAAFTAPAPSPVAQEIKKLERKLAYVEAGKWLLVALGFLALTVFLVATEIVESEAALAVLVLIPLVVCWVKVFRISKRIVGNFLIRLVGLTVICPYTLALLAIMALANLSAYKANRARLATLKASL